MYHNDFIYVYLEQVVSFVLETFIIFASFLFLKKYLDPTPPISEIINCSAQFFNLHAVIKV